MPGRLKPTGRMTEAILIALCVAIFGALFWIATGGQGDSPAIADTPHVSPEPDQTRAARNPSQP